ncbi:hypothetical protein C8J56DRAFT_1139633 [Mycena floridula]|nr:hypothetical protein C8J56DRAFT_1139633 [Mycena floridula]
MEDISVFNRAGILLAALPPRTIAHLLEKTTLKSLPPSRIPWASSVLRAAAESLVDATWDSGTEHWPLSVCFHGLRTLKLAATLPNILASLGQCLSCIIWIKNIRNTDVAERLVHDHLLSIVFPQVQMLGGSRRLGLLLDALTLPALQTMQINGSDVWQSAVLLHREYQQCSYGRTADCNVLSYIIFSSNDGFSECLKPEILPELEAFRIIFAEDIWNSTGYTYPFFIPDSVLEALTWDADARSLPKLSNLGLMIGFTQVSTPESTLVTRLSPGENTLILLLQTIIETQHESYTMDNAVDNIQSKDGLEFEMETYFAEDSASDNE